MSSLEEAICFLETVHIENASQTICQLTGHASSLANEKGKEHIK